MPFIASIRTDIPAGTLQFLDLQPNDSQRNYILDPPAQAKYARRPDNDDIVLATAAGNRATSAEYKGVAAWLVDHIEDTPNGDSLTGNQAVTIGTALIARMDGGLALATSDVNTVVQATVGGSGIGIGGSTGTLTELLEVMTGGVYVLPAGSVVDTDGSTWNPVTLGSLTHSRHIFYTGSFNISRGEGKLFAMAQATFTHLGTAGAAIVLYDDDGTLL